MEQANAVVCICETPEEALSAMKSLQTAGIDMRTLSIATKDIANSDRPADHYNVGDQTFKIPLIGPVLVWGPLGSWIVTAQDRGTEGANVTVVGTALATLGIPQNSILEYETALITGRSILILHGAPDAVARAVKLIGGTTHCVHTVHGEKVYDTVRGVTSRALSTAPLHA